MMANETQTDLDAKVTALEIIVETLLVDHLAEDPCPAVIGDAMIKSAFESEQRVREQVGDDRYAMKITEEIVSLVERAAQRAKKQRQARP
jgi:hypothetical protein